MISRRALFFFVVAFVCLILVPVTPAEFRWVALAAAALAAFWGVALSLEDVLSGRYRSRRTQARPRRPDPAPESPLSPPPAPGHSDSR